MKALSESRVNEARGLKPYFDDGLITLYHGDCLEVTEWLAADVLVMDPPYGRDWKLGSGLTNSSGRGAGTVGRGGIANDKDTKVRDAALALFDGPAIVFGDPLIAQPVGAVQALVFAKAEDAGVMGARAGMRRDVEMVYLVGAWPASIGGGSSVLTTVEHAAGPTSAAARFGHSHAKPLDVMMRLVSLSGGIVADPFAGSGSTLVAAQRLGRRAIGVELDEKYCEIAARRLSQQPLDLEVT